MERLSGLMLIHQLPLDEASSTLRSTAAGLSSGVASDRKREFGPNRIEEVRPASLPRRFLAQFTHFFAWLLWIAAALAFIAEVHAPGQGMATLAVAIVAVIVVNGSFSFWQEYRAEGTMAALQGLLPHQVRLQREGVVVVLTADEVVPGDVILLSAGDHVPADCRLIEAFGVRVSNATVTGEPRPVSRDAHPGTKDHLPIKVRSSGLPLLQAFDQPTQHPAARYRRHEPSRASTSTPSSARNTSPALPNTERQVRPAHANRGPFPRWLTDIGRRGDNHGATRILRRMPTPS